MNKKVIILFFCLLFLLQLPSGQAQLTCQVGQFWNLNTQQCENCLDTNCGQCKSADGCLKCKPSFFLDLQMKCQACIVAGCVECPPFNSCFRCQKDMYFDGKICKKCDLNICGVCGQTGCD